MIENILVHKFGGASVGSATSVRNLAIIADNQNGNILIVVSAMDKTTNALEIVADHYFRGTGGVSEKLSEIREFHFNIIRDLFPDSQEMIYSDIEKLFSELNDRLSINPGNDYDYEYDQIVSYGELFSAKIISAYLNKAGVANIWTDARKFLKTDRVFRDAKADIDASLPLVRQQFTFTNNKVYVCQGFIGSDDEGFTTTLGREGSDYTASVMAYMLGAREVVIWKDVAGIYNIDPKYHSSNRNGHTTSYDPDMINPVRLDEISYQEAIELAYYGAKIIHPKTIKFRTVIFHYMSGLSLIRKKQVLLFIMWVILRILFRYISSR
ncbi:MAG: hypothetical protein NTW49_12575 [Bacteroidia bacterium]|nr:hypothetical protein [Bacteroidia bacterium]